MQRGASRLGGRRRGVAGRGVSWRSPVVCAVVGAPFSPAAAASQVTMLFNSLDEGAEGKRAVTS